MAEKAKKNLEFQKSYFLRIKYPLYPIDGLSMIFSQANHMVSRAFSSWDLKAPYLRLETDMQPHNPLSCPRPQLLGADSPHEG